MPTKKYRAMPRTRKDLFLLSPLMTVTKIVKVPTMPYWFQKPMRPMSEKKTPSSWSLSIKGWTFVDIRLSPSRCLINSRWEKT